MADLNTSQQKAVEENGALLILAGPGSGKTKVITEKILHLMKNGVKPENILALTFSDKAAKEMVDRLEKETDTSQLTISTFHSFCRQALEDNVLDSGISFASGVISRANQLVWGLKNIDSFGLEYLEVGNNEVELIESLMDGISSFRDELISPEDLEEYLKKKDTNKDGLNDEEKDLLGKLKDMLKVYRAYEKYKRKEALMDFDDMIHETSDLFSKKPLILKRYREKYTHVLVDEFQDTNFAQLFLIKQLAGENIFVVGDDDQSIYRFRGAYLTNFQDFKVHFKKHQQILLNQNYRNSKNILTLSLQLINKAKNREKKDLETANHEGDKVIVAVCGNEQAEADFVLKEIQKLVGKKFYSRTDKKEREMSYKDIAILSRKKAHGGKFNTILRKNGIPCEFVGEVDFFSAAPVRNMAAWLKVIENPLRAGIYLSRIMKISGVTEINMQKINEHAKKKRGKEDHEDFVFESMENAEEILSSQKEHVKEVVGTIKKMLELKEKATLAELVYNVMIKHTDLYKKSLDDSRNRLLLNRFYGIAQEYEATTKNASVSGFLEHTEMLRRFQIEMDEAEETDSVKIMTIHQSKGKEFAVVFIVDVADRKFPLRYTAKPIYVPNDLSKGMKTNDDEKELYLQEERRLLYVAMTRAEQKLYMTFAEQYGDNKTKTKPSKFLEDIGYSKNPLIEAVSVKPESRADITVAQSLVEKARAEIQEACTKAVNQMQLKTALQKIVELEKLKQLEERGEVDFDREKFFEVEDSDGDIKRLFEGKKLPIIKADHGFSATALNNYNDCPLKYKFQNVLLVPTIKKTYFGLGSAVHKVMELLTKGERDGIKPTKERVLEILGKFWSSASYITKKKEEEDRREAERMLDDFLEWHKLNSNKVIDAEYEFTFKLGGRIIHGFIDRIEQDSKGNYIVVDFKTGSVQKSSNTIREDIQMNVYCLALLNSPKFGKLPERASLFYIKHNKMIDYLPDQISVEAQKKMLEEMINSVLAEKFTATPSFKDCGWCDYFDICDEKEVEE